MREGDENLGTNSAAPEKRQRWTSERNFAAVGHKRIPIHPLIIY